MSLVGYGGAACSGHDQAGDACAGNAVRRRICLHPVRRQCGDYIHLDPTTFQSSTDSDRLGHTCAAGRRVRSAALLGTDHVLEVEPGELSHLLAARVDDPPARVGGEVDLLGREAYPRGLEDVGEFDRRLGVRSCDTHAQPACRSEWLPRGPQQADGRCRGLPSRGRSPHCVRRRRARDELRPRTQLRLRALPRLHLWHGDRRRGRADRAQSVHGTDPALPYLSQPGQQG